MYAGGIPQDSSWYKDSSVWINIANLRDYFTAAGSGHYYWGLAATRLSLVGGDMITLSHLDSTGKKLPDPYHVYVVVYNDGTIIKIDSHSTDRKLYTYNGSAEDTYYMVVM